MPDDGTVGEDFFQGDVAAGLERVRLRLLDLTNRNRLLNFRYPKRSKSVLRVVDELPDQLCEQLLDGSELSFDPVRKPTRQELDEWRRDRMRSLSGPSIRSDDVDLRAESQSEPTAEEFGRRIGIRTEHDLPEPDDGVMAEDRHQDDRIQTLLFPEALERVLASLAAKARLAIEETGSNMLYLAFGFLRWYEADSSDASRLAPLYLVPASLVRQRLKRGDENYRFHLCYSDEDLIANISLQERMARDFGLKIPDIDDDVLPEEYFASVQHAVRSQARWKVLRHATVCMLSFGKLLMYKDLDPSAWPDGSLVGHKRIRDFFVGREDNEPAVAPERPIDALDGIAPPLAADADSSQHSVLVDALLGKNLVVEGPPGTGKSQTIMNLIAAAMEAGKTVLFVSEKLAALEVVRKRLNDAGLGQFCLELHSHRSRKKDLLGDIEDRIRCMGAFADDPSLDEEEERLRQLRDRLNAYAELINSRAGTLGCSVHSAMWAAQRRQRMLDDWVGVLEELSEPDAAQMTATALREEKERLTAFVDALGEVVRESSSVSEHPWFGVGNPGLSRLDQREVGKVLRRLRDHANQVSSRFTDTTGAARKLAEALQAVPERPEGVREKLMAALGDGRVRSAVSCAAASLEKRQRAIRDIMSVSPRSLEDPRRWLERLLDVGSAPTWFQPDWKVAEIPVKVEEFQRDRSALESLRDRVGQVSGHLKLTLPDSLEGLELAVAAGQVAASAPHFALYLRDQIKTDPDVLPLAQRLEEARTRLVDRRKKSDLAYDIDSLPDAQTLRSHAAALMTAGILGWAKPMVRAARRCLRELARNRVEGTAQDQARELRSLADLAASLYAFRSDRQLARVAGPVSAGIGTPLPDVIALLEWRQLGRAAFADPGMPDVSEALQAADPAALQAIAGIGEELQASEEVTEAIARLSAIAGPCPSLGELSRALDAVDRAIRVFASLLSELNCPDGATVGDVVALPDLLREFHQAETELANNEVGRRVAGDADDPQILRRALDAAEEVDALTLPQPMRDFLFTGPFDQTRTKLVRLGVELDRKIQAFVEVQAAWRECAHPAPGVWGEDVTTGNGPVLSDLVARAERALEQIALFDHWTSFIRARGALNTETGQALATLLESARLPTELAVPAFEWVVYSSLVNHAFRQHQSLVSFKGTTHDRLRREFAELDRRLLQLRRHRMAAAIDSRPVPGGKGVGPVAQFSDLALLRHEIKKKKRHLPIRQLVWRAGGALQALKPCFMMGPLSVAQYLDREGLRFDMVVMDEASQLRPEDALGAVARGGQLVVVGDTKQLPPTNFFDRIDEIDEEEEEESLAGGVLDAESILDVAAMAYRPSRVLRWHYRSRHGSLIAFSNEHFYRNDLIVFPSRVVESPLYGVKWHKVRGHYRARRNVPEASTVVEFALQHMRRRPEESLGLVTLNTTQRDLIQEELDQRIKKDRDAQRFLAEWEKGLEPFFVKNLENVQGDERDVIVVSVTYGPDEHGRVYQRFGPINGPTGHRRLNVLFTRARNRVEVFSSISGDQISVSEASNEGVTALKGYLDFAEKGFLQQVRFSGREPDSDFEVEVAEALQRRGYEVVAQVGVAGYFIDLAVRHPERPGAFVLGIECDGASYHSAKSARDRDRLRQEVLEDKGWTIHRIWSTDWFCDPDRETQRTVEAIETARANEPEPIDEVDMEYEVYTENTAEAESAPSEAELDRQDDLRPADEVAGDEVRGSPESVRADLETMRDEVLAPNFPDIPMEQNILRPELLEVLLRARPVTREEWLRRIPLDLRIDTAPEHMVLLDDILDIVSRNSD